MSPVYRDGRVPVVPVPPGDLGGAAHPDPGSGDNVSRTDRVARPGARPGRRPGDAHVRAVERPVDAERLAEPGRPASQVTGRDAGPGFGDGAPGAPGAGQVLARDDRAGPQQYGGSAALLPQA